jgi:CRP/FNR family cyclic AMP-dependent transcriptional regulator
MGKHPHFIWEDLFRKRKRSDLVRTLKDNVLFCKLTQRELNYLSNFVYERVFEPNEVIFSQSDRGVGMYLIASGRVAIKTHSTSDEYYITELGEGSFLGELSLVDPEHIRSANAIALDRAKLIGFFKPDLEDILARNPAMGVKILFQLSTVLGRRLLETTDKITQLKEQLKEHEPSKVRDINAKAA